MRVCKVVVFMEYNKPAKIKSYIHPGGRICDMVHGGTIILLDGENEGATEIRYETMETGPHRGRLIAFLADDYPAKIKMGIYCVREV